MEQRLSCKQAKSIFKLVTCETEGQKKQLHLTVKYFTENEYDFKKKRKI